ncbi:MAG: DUF362 domain-containing protein [Spirochaetota bacterium]|nr:MAG: DUF362 domain-containing protein [Spirochaetota bacterium]
MSSRVSIIRCDSYDEDEVYRAVKRGIEYLGGATQAAKSGERIVLKPNVLWGDRPETCINTHPSVFEAIGRILREIGADLLYGDSPGFGKPEYHMRKSGIMSAAQKLGIPLADFEHGMEVEFKDSPFTKLFTVAKGALDCDGLVSIPKLKTHGLMRMTGAVKNQFGCVPGVQTHVFHIRIPNPYDFARMLVSLNLLLKMRLFILDGIMAMEGNGPRGGRPVKMGFLLFSKDPVALDTIMCRTIGLEPEIVPTNPIGMEYGLGICNLDEIELVGDPIDELINIQFDVLRTPVPSRDMHKVPSFIKKALFSRPVIDSERCSKCGTCVEVCRIEPKAINWIDASKKNPPVYAYDRCIRCYCCQELCPENAIFIKQPLVRKLLTRQIMKSATSRKGKV